MIGQNFFTICHKYVIQKYRPPPFSLLVSFYEFTSLMPVLEQDMTMKEISPYGHAPVFPFILSHSLTHSLTQASQPHRQIRFEVMVSVLIRTFYHQTLLISYDQGSTTLSIGIVIVLDNI